MAYKSGPLISPAVFAQRLAPRLATMAGQGVGAHRSNAGARGGGAIRARLERDQERAAQHCQLVAQDEYLGVLGQGIHLVDAAERKKAAQEPAEERKGHGRAA